MCETKLDRAWGQDWVGSIDAAKLDDASAHVGGELIAQRAARHADDGELFGQQVRLEEMKERGQQLALGQVARGAEDDENAGVGNALCRPWEAGKDPRGGRSFAWWPWLVEPPAERPLLASSSSYGD